MKNRSLIREDLPDSCRFAFRIAAVTKWLIFLAVVQALPLSAAPPNVVFLLIDDMGYADLSCYGEKRVHTDHIDQLAREGIRFTQFYVNAPICSPSRTAFTTGQYPARWKITSYLAKRADDAKRGCADWLDPKAPTLARSLKAAGYTTGHFGKWHMGGQRDVGDAPLITEYGFDKTLTTFEGLGDRVLPILDSFDGKPARKFELGLMSERLGRGKITWADRSRETSYFVNAALDFVKHAEATGTPFFVDLWPDDVHSPFFPPKALRGDGSKKELYLGVVQATDDQVAPLLDYIRNSPTLRDNTLIIVASDNGPEPGAGSAGPFRGEKGNLYEGGVREPFIVWAPALIDKAAAGTTNEKTVVAAVDFLPSIQTITGVHRRDDQLEDGQDMSKSLLGKEQAIRTKPLFWIRPPDRRGPNPKKNPWPDLSVRDGDWKLLINEDGSRPQLYDLGNDIGETKNLATDKPEIVARLKEMLMKWRATLPVTLPKVTADLRGPS